MGRGTLLLFSVGITAAYAPLFVGLIALGFKLGLSGGGLESVSADQMAAIAILAGWGIGLHILLWLLQVIMRWRPPGATTNKDDS